LAVLRTVSANAEDLERLTQIALAAKESGAGNAEVAEQIRTTIPRLKPVADWLLSPQGAALAAWLAVIVAVIIRVTTPTSSSPAPDSHPAPPAPTSQTLIINCPRDQEDAIRDLFEQAIHEIHAELKQAAEVKRSPSESNSEHLGDRDHHESDSR
jgi:hypothetical protein